MLKTMKNAFPSTYSWYQHVKRLFVIRRTNRLKHKTIEDYKIMLSKLYCKEIGHKIDWDHLSTYTEKMQWAKLYDNNPLKSVLSDKYAVRNWVKTIIGDEHLIPILGVWNCFDEIDFSVLPKQFVLKTNHGSGTNLIVKDKNKLDLKNARRFFNDWMKIDFAFVNGFELHYSKIKPLIIAEQYMETANGELQDYKFLCFDGKPYYCWVDIGRNTNHSRTVFDLDWNVQPWRQVSCPSYDKPIPKPQNYNKMIDIVTKLCQGFPHVRVDLYNVNGNIYFGEMTFSSGSGFNRIVPERYDMELGALWDLSMKEVVM
ncbi:MAG: ATP-grasp fold amidoligase family protein [Fastidiosipilaceae bacterium]|jgi:hypothetical protein